MVVEGAKTSRRASQKMTATLEAGEYDMTCGLLSNPKGKRPSPRQPTAPPTANQNALDLVGPIAEYKVYVIKEVDGLVKQTSCSPTR